MPRVPHFAKCALVFPSVHLCAVKSLKSLYQVVLVADLFISRQSEVEFCVDLIDIGVIAPSVEIGPRAVGAVLLAQTLCKLLTFREQILEPFCALDSVKTSLKDHFGHASLDSDSVLPVPSVVLEPLTQNEPLEKRCIKLSFPGCDFLKYKTVIAFHNTLLLHDRLKFSVYPLDSLFMEFELVALFGQLLFDSVRFLLYFCFVIFDPELVSGQVPPEESSAVHVILVV